MCCACLPAAELNPAATKLWCLVQTDDGCTPEGFAEALAAAAAAAAAAGGGGSGDASLGSATTAVARGSLNADDGLHEGSSRHMGGEEGTGAGEVAAVGAAEEVEEVEGGEEEATGSCGSVERGDTPLAMARELAGAKPAPSDEVGGTAGSECGDGESSQLLFLDEEGGPRASYLGGLFGVSRRPEPPSRMAAKRKLTGMHVSAILEDIETQEATTVSAAAAAAADSAADAEGGSEGRPGSPGATRLGGILATGAGLAAFMLHSLGQEM